MAAPENYDQNGLSSVYDHFGRNRKYHSGLALFHRITLARPPKRLLWMAIQPFLIDPIRTLASSTALFVTILIAEYCAKM